MSNALARKKKRMQPLGGYSPLTKVVSEEEINRILEQESEG